MADQQPLVTSEPPTGPRASLEAVSPPIDVLGIPTRHRRVGAGSPVVVLHGWGARIEAVHPIVEALRGRHTVLAPDLPGFGETGLPPAPWGVADYCRWTLAFLDTMGIERTSLVGHSLGGRIGIYLASHHPERIDRMILVDSAGIRPRRGLTYYRKVALAKAGKHAARHLGAPGRSLHRRALARSASPDYRDAGPLRPTFVRIVSEDLQPLLTRITAPTLLIWGGQDTATPVSDGRLMERLIPDAGLVVFESAGHYSYLDEPGRFARVALHFLHPPRATA
jgi:pimeloyl-ACP methyl ester carboxylesterase